MFLTGVLVGLVSGVVATGLLVIAVLIIAAERG